MDHVEDAKRAAVIKQHVQLHLVPLGTNTKPTARGWGEEWGTGPHSRMNFSSAP